MDDHVIVMTIIILQWPRRANQFGIRVAVHVGDLHSVKLYVIYSLAILFNISSHII